MTIKIHKSSKFENAPEQYFAEAGGYTLLRLVYTGHGGTIMTATACDDRLVASPVYRDRKSLNSSMIHGVVTLGGRAQYVDEETDGKGRRFVRTDYDGTRKKLLGIFEAIAEEMVVELGLASSSSAEAGYSDMRDLYDDLCHTEGEPVYLSDGVYLYPDGSLSG